MWVENISILRIERLHGSRMVPPHSTAISTMQIILTQIQIFSMPRMTELGRHVGSIDV